MPAALALALGLGLPGAAGRTSAPPRRPRPPPLPTRPPLPTPAAPRDSYTYARASPSPVPRAPSRRSPSTPTSAGRRAGRGRRVRGRGRRGRARRHRDRELRGRRPAVGQVFDSSWQRGEPATFPLDGVIQGWSQGLVGMQPGGRRLLVIPAELAYGDAGAGADIAPGETLVFVVDLIDAGSGRLTHCPDTTELIRPERNPMADLTKPEIDFPEGPAPDRPRESATSSSVRAPRRCPGAQVTVQLRRGRLRQRRPVRLPRGTAVSRSPSRWPGSSRAGRTVSPACASVAGASWSSRRALAYGENGRHALSGKTLIFVIDLLAVR